MLIRGFAAGAWNTNCWVVAPAVGEECVIIDPGQDATNSIDEILRADRLKPVAVLLTHGHVDHVFSVFPVCGARDIPAWIHSADRYMLTDPGRGLGLVVGKELFGGATFAEPSDVRELTDDTDIELAGLRISVNHAPGHTKGSVTFRTPQITTPGEEVPPVLFSGDLLFAGSIGRTDLPGGDYPSILSSLARVCLPLPDETIVLSGHGERTTIGQERATNPFLREAAPLAAPIRRGL